MGVWILGGTDAKIRGKLLALQLDQFFVTVELLRLQSVKVLVRCTFPL